VTLPSVTFPVPVTADAPPVVGGSITISGGRTGTITAILPDGTLRISVGGIMYTKLPTRSSCVGPSGGSCRGTPSRRALDQVANAVSPLTLRLAAGRRARLLYGQVQVAAEIAAVATATSGTRYLYLLSVWGLGEIDSIVSVSAGDAALSSTNVVSYTGTVDQTADPWLAAAISGYADTLRGTVHGRAVSLAYSVIRAAPTASNPADRLRAVVKGRKVYDPRTDTSAWSDNAALCLADALAMAGETVDWAAVEDAADYCDESVAGQPRWTLNLALAEPLDVPTLVEGLRGYAHCFVVRGSGGVRLVPDTTAASVWHLTAADVLAGTLRLSRAGRRQIPTVVRVGYTRTDQDPYGTGTAEARHSQVDSGLLPWRESNIALPGCDSHAEAYRHAVERLNAFWLRDLRADLTVFDGGLELQAGDVVSLTHPIGLSAKLLRVLSVTAAEPGRWALTTEEYDPAVYSDAVAETPTYGDTELPSPFEVPAPTGLVASEEVYQLESGLYASRLRLAWSVAAYPYSAQSQVRVYAGADLVWSLLTTDTQAVTGPVQEGVAYSARVAIVAAIGVTGAEASTNITAQGKGLIPGDVPAVYGIEAGGEVRLRWDPAVDIDIWRYEVRWGEITDTWADATLLDRVDSLRVTTRDVPAGTWRFFVKAIDSVGQYSTNAAVKDLVVTLDTRAFFVDQYSLAYDLAESSNIYTSTRRDGRVRRWSEVGIAVDTLWPDAADTYKDIAAAYDVGSASEWESSAADFGSIYTGQWQFDARAITALGSWDAITINYELSSDGSSWDTYTADVIKATARYARVRVAAASGNALLQAGTVTVRLDVVAREESGIITTSASAAATVTLSSDYDFTKAIVLTPQGVTSPPTAGAIAVYDNIDLVSSPNTFDIYLFSTAGAQLSGDVSWRFQGV
jgi:hypothetical protein